MSRARAYRSQKYLVLFTLLISPFAARAIDLDLKVEPGVAYSTHQAQKDRFELGGAGTVKGLVGAEGGWVNLALGLTFLGLPSQTGFGQTNMGTAWAPSFGLRIEAPRESEWKRLQHPHQRESFYGARPWIDADMMYVRTGGLDRIGFAAAV